jgi:hypothetical protein
MRSKMWERGYSNPRGTVPNASPEDRCNFVMGQIERLLDEEREEEGDASGPVTKSCANVRGTYERHC